MTKADKGISLKLALDYQLISEKTACYVDVNLAENQQSDGQPEIRKVPSMLASGYGGISENQSGLLLDTLDLPFDAGGTRYLERPACLRMANESIEPKSPLIADVLQSEISGIDDEHLVLSQVEQFYNRNNRLPLNESELLQCGLDEKLIGDLLFGYTTDEEIARAIALFLYKQLRSLSEAVSKSFSREIRVIAKQRIAPTKAKQSIKC
jgi:hypothetical protein